MVCSNPNFETDHNFLFSGNTMAIILYIYSPWYFVKNRSKKTFDFNTSFERPLFKLSDLIKLTLLDQRNQSYGRSSSMSYPG